ncbi:MAG TPA: histidinol dehydrogenase [Tepidisphaeraceae bacterium]|jgi:histidinol dehydrogenase|nr:histidinol dehydrogenase [Tepidisphaeraceae bacterium]
MIPTFRLDNADGRSRVEALLGKLRLMPADVALGQGKDVAAVQEILADVARRGDAAVVDSSRKFDDPNFTIDQIRVKPEEMADAAKRIPAELMSALRRSIAQVREYQRAFMPVDPPRLERAGVSLGMRFTPMESAGLYFPGGKASYPSSLIHLAVPAQVAGVKRIAVATPPSKYGRSDLVLAAAHELGLTDVFRAGGAAAIAALAFGTQTIASVDKIVGPGNKYVQLAKRALAGCVGIDGFLGPSEILVLADESASPAFIAADLIAQAEHDPGSCFLLTTSEALAKQVVAEIEKQGKSLSRLAALEKAMRDFSAIIVGGSMDELIALADQFAAEHVNVQTKDDEAVLRKLSHAGAVFLGRYSPVAAGDYVAGPSHCLPTNTTARFTSGISVYEFLKRSSVVRYEANGLNADADAITAMAEAEGLDGHAASVRVRGK